jgi:hypothetical protein
MSAASFLRVQKLNGAGIIRTAGRHNLREIQAELGASGSIDATRTHMNQTLAGPATADDVAQLAKDLMQAAGATSVRKNAVTGLELVASLPPNHQLDDVAYFTDCLTWAQAHFNCPVLSATIHRDEAAPHLHILLLPLVDGRLNGHRLMGGPAQIMAMQKSFHETVASKYGLRKAPPRLAGSAKHAAAALVLAKLRETGDSALRSDLWPSIRACIENGPQTFLEALGLVAESKTKKVRTMAQIFTSKGKGAARDDSKPSTTNDISVANLSKLDSDISNHPKVTIMKTTQTNDISVANQAPKTEPICLCIVSKSPPTFSTRSKPASGKVTVMPEDDDHDDDDHLNDTPMKDRQIDRDDFGRDFDADDGYSRGRDPFDYIDQVEAPSWQD